MSCPRIHHPSWGHAVRGERGALLRAVVGRGAAAELDPLRQLLLLDPDSRAADSTSSTSNL